MAKLNTEVIEEKQQPKGGYKAQVWALHQGLGDILSLLTYVENFHRQFSMEGSGYLEQMPPHVAPLQPYKPHSW